MSTGAWDILTLVVALLVMVGCFYYYIAGIHFEDRSLSRASALAFLVFGVLAAAMLVKIFL